MQAFALTGPQLLGYLQKAFEGYSGTITNTVALLIVFIFSEVVDSGNFFRCPPEYYKFYAACFLFVPALFLFMTMIFLNIGFWNFVRGCCYYERRKTRWKRRYCCCFYPRWPCRITLWEIIFQSSLSGFVWIFWALLQRKYYTCYALGGTKEAKLKEATTDQEKLQIEYEYANAGKTSQTIALSLLCGVLVVAFVTLSVARCCCQREVGSLPTVDEVERLESEAAVKAFRENMQQLAQQEGKKYADMYFPVTAFEERGHQAQLEGEQKQSNLKAFMSAAREKIGNRYPRATGNMSQPYVNYENKETDLQALSRGIAEHTV